VHDTWRLPGPDPGERGSNGHRPRPDATYAPGPLSYPDLPEFTPFKASAEAYDLDPSRLRPPVPRQPTVSPTGLRPPSIALPPAVGPEAFRGLNLPRRPAIPPRAVPPMVRFVVPPPVARPPTIPPPPPRPLPVFGPPLPPASLPAPEPTTPDPDGSGPRTKRGS